MLAETKAKIEKHIRKHRKSGGRAESPEHGVDDAKKDLDSKPEDYTAKNKVSEEAEEKKAKRGGRMKKEVGKADGERAHHHAGRRHRASGGSCEANPFTSAKSGTSPKGRMTEREGSGSSV